MDLTPLIRSDSKVIQGYKGGVFRISGEKYESAVFVFPDRLLSWDFKGDPLHFSIEDFEPLLKLSETLDVVLLGTGDRSVFLPQPLRQELKDAGLNIDVMDTSAACRTYNVLMAEGRRVTAALLPVS